jgi:putative RNA 2'-phosphotransferase
MPTRVKFSKFLSLVLRHRPDIIGLCLDEAGWTKITDLVEKARKVGVNLTSTLILQVATASDKQRFSISPDGKRIRANQGHSVAVELGLLEKEPPDTLYHGTARHNLAAIRSQGINHGKRNHVHLSSDISSAISVGSRHGQPVVLIVLAAEMNRAGFRFYRSENGVWLTEYVPPEYLMLLRVSSCRANMR